MSANQRVDEALELLRQQRFAEARQKLTPIVARTPENIEARIALATAQMRTGGVAMAEYACLKMVKEGRLEHTQLADVCEILSQTSRANLAESVRVLTEAVEKHPDWVKCRVALGIQLLNTGDFHAAIAHGRRLLEHHPEYASIAHRILADANRSLGNHAVALEHYRAGMWADPENVNHAEMVAFISNGVESVTPEQSFHAHIKHARLIEGYAADIRFDHPATDDPGRRLRVGVVSYDLNHHSVACFLHGFARSLDRRGFELWAYHTANFKDRVTEGLRPLFDRYVEVPAITSVELAKRVHADKVDVLIDLNGLTMGQRLHAFQLKPAPVQLTWLGYANTTGLRAIDYRVVDSISDPPGTDRFAVEKLVRLDPCFLCFTPLQQRTDLLGPGWSPPAWTPEGHVRFGCFNNVAKITDRVLDIWGAVLAGTGNATITIKARGLEDPASREAMHKRFTDRNIPLDRLVVLAPTESIRGHLEHYGQVDIALDTFPYNGTTTTCDALNCGVPVVTYTGDRHAARVSASLLCAMDLPELVGRTQDEMVRIAVELASDRERLGRLRTSLADRFVASAVCDGPAFADRFGRALREMWRVRCAEGVRR